MSGSNHSLIGDLPLMGLPNAFSRVRIMPYCQRVQKYDYIKPEAINANELGLTKREKERLARALYEEETDEVTPMKKEKEITLHKFNAEEWKLRRLQQKNLNLTKVEENRLSLSIDEPTQRLNVSDQPSRRFSTLIDERLKTEHSIAKPSDTPYPRLTDVSRVGSFKYEVPKQIEIKTPELQPEIKTPLSQPEMQIPVLQPEVKVPVRKSKGISLSDLVESKISKTQQPPSSSDDIPVVKMRQKKRFDSPDSKPSKNDGSLSTDDPVVKLQQKMKLIQDQVGKVMEKVSIPDPPRPAKEAQHYPEFDMDAWRKEREKVRNSRFFEDVEIKPYERKTFQDVEIRPGWETKTVREPTPEPEPVPEPVPPPKPVEPEPPSGPKYDSKNLYRANSIHTQRSSESVPESRKSSLPHIMNFSIKQDTFKKKTKKDMSWAQPPDDAASDEEISMLRSWLDSFKENKLDPLAVFGGSVPTKKTHLIALQKAIDPYYNLWGESYTVESVTSSLQVTSESLSGLNDACEFKHGKGYGEITFKNGDIYQGEYCKGRRDGNGKQTFVEGPILCVEGIYENDILHGRGMVTYRNGEKLHCTFDDNFIQGYTVLIDANGEVKQVGKYSRGMMTGLQWNYMEGGGFMVGKTDVSGILSGEDVTFLYPDLRIGLTGTFISGKMAIGQTCFLKAVIADDALLSPIFTLGSGPQITFEQGTQTSIGDNPLLPDPYEFNWVYVRSSRIKGAYEGLFARQAIPKDRIVSFYNGTRMKIFEMTDSKDDYESNAYKIMDMLGKDENGNEGILDIPLQFRSLKNYCATLAHKTNHSFDPNAKFFLFDHPRFGKVPAIKTLEEINKDQEITVSYDYGLDDAPPWYQDLYSLRVINIYQSLKNYEAVPSS